MLRKIFLGLAISVLALTLVGCGTSTNKEPQQNTGSQAPTSNTQQNSDDNSKTVHLTPIPEGTPLVTANTEVSKQIMGQKDVLGTQIYEQLGIVYGDITFKSEVDKDYAHGLANEFLTQLKVTYPSREILTQVIIDGKTADSISFKP
ncbi:MAG: hypothetical protein ACYDEX_25545 [Mobilitalea sp.]